MMVKKSMVIWTIIGAVMVAGAVAWGPIASDVEQAKYTVVAKHDAIEIRDYDPMIIAEVTTQGERDQAINDGFRLLAEYIFGGNQSRQNVPMTAPVTQIKNEKIAMTAPVMQESTSENQWKIQFMMPSNHTLESLPEPNNPSVQLNEVPGKRFATIRFSGLTNKNNIEHQEKQLEQFISEKKLVALSPPTYAFFNPPWTLPPLRRNEVMIEISK